jgi:NAD-dependent SIR2 family protein deacetylase
VSSPDFQIGAVKAEQGVKSPTPAHRAIAELVADGYVWVILTTNFDRLIERAVTDKGIAPTVIASPDAVEGALPFAHSACSARIQALHWL